MLAPLACSTHDPPGWRRWPCHPLRQGAVPHLLDHAGDFAGGRGGAFGQLAHFVGHHGKAAALLTSAGGFNGGVQRQQIGLVSDFTNHGDNAGNLLGFLGHGVNARAASCTSEAMASISLAVDGNRFAAGVRAGAGFVGNLFGGAGVFADAGNAGGQGFHRQGHRRGRLGLFHRAQALATKPPTPAGRRQQLPANFSGYC